MSLRELKEQNRIVIWPSYFLSQTRSKGRRVRKITRKIRTEELIEIMKELDLDPIVIENKKYPRDRKVNFIITVKKVKSKNNTLKIIYTKLMNQSNIKGLENND
ncbi:signal recognition particle subunit SRP19/SEC65 family protein [Sulfolobus tengchongensis]|uniref:Signal recognition particle subunit SRP19/SEC65 family protein n=1 Tax=Sulfolobus tengchongensis TaxID=207809 RepID=A0AAX4KYB1_9CREN